MKNVLLLLVIGASVVFSSCNKYPDDIPDWLKDKIKALNKETRWHKGCVNDHCMKIDEFTLNGETLYFFDPGYNGNFGYQLFIVYDESGIQKCEWQPAVPSTYCDDYAIAHKTRRIWGEKE